MNAVRNLFVVLLAQATFFSGGLSMENFEKATFGGGCFWCVEAVFEGLEGVRSVVSGYAGGTKENPTYEDVCSGTMLKLSRSPLIRALCRTKSSWRPSGWPMTRRL